MGKTRTTKKTLPQKGASELPKLSPKARSRWDGIVTRIKSLLHEKGWSQGDLAKQAEIHRPFLSRILNTPTNLTLETIAQLEKALKEDLICIPTIGANSKGGRELIIRVIVP